MAVHIGQEIWKAMKRADMSREALALALNRSITKVNHIFSKADIDTGMLMQISNILNHNFFSNFQLDAVQDQQIKALLKSDDKEITRLKLLIKEKNSLLKLQSQTIKSLEDIIATIERA